MNSLPDYENHCVFEGRIGAIALAIALLISVPAFAQAPPVFTPGNLVVAVEGCGVHGGTCTAVPNGSGTGSGTSSAGGYGDNQAAPLTLFQYTPNGTSSVTFVNSLVFPQTASGANFPVSGEYGSSSEGTLQLSGPGQYLTIMGYGINALTFNAAEDPSNISLNLYGASPSGALAQSGSLTGQSYTPVPRVVALIDANGNINSSTASYNVFDTNNPRSVYTADGFNFYISGQGTGCDLTGGVFLTTLGAINDASTAITGGDAVPTSTCVSSGYTGSLVAQDTRTVQIYDDTLYISIDSTEGKSDNRALIGTLGNPPAMGLFSPTEPPTGDTGGPNLIPGLGNTGGTGKETITSGANSNGNGLNTGLQINLSPSNYFFANASTLYVVDTGSPKQTSATSTLGDGGLQKWIYSSASGTWSLAYTLYQGLNLVQNPTAKPSNTDGTTGLYGLTGMVSGNTVYLYATNYTISDLDQTYLYGITDSLSATTNPGTSFTLLDTAPPDSNFKGVSFAPTIPAGDVEITTSPSGLTFTSSGTGCEPGSPGTPLTLTTPQTLAWTPGSSCTLSVVSPQSGGPGVQYVLSQWQDGTTATTDAVVAPTGTATYTASFTTEYQLTTAAGAGGTVSAGGYIPAGTDATITATPSAGYYFVDFTGTTASGSSPLSLLMNAPQSITANFAPQIVSTITWPMPGAITYGTALSPSQLDAMSSDMGTLAYNPPVGTVLPAGSNQPLSVSFTPSSGEYTTAVGNTTITVIPAILTVTGYTGSVPFDTPIPSAVAMPIYSGFVNGNSAANLTSQATCSTTATSSSPVGSYPVICSGASSNNYTFNYQAGSLTITQDVLTITASSATITYGTMPPRVRAIYSGFTGGDTPASLRRRPVCRIQGLSSGLWEFPGPPLPWPPFAPFRYDPVGVYTDSCSGAVDPKYAFTYVTGTLTIVPAPLTIAARNETITEGQPIPPLGAVYIGFLPGDGPYDLTGKLTCDTTATSSSPAGTYPITCSGQSSTNYAITFVRGTLTITAPPPPPKWPEPPPRF